MTLRRARKDQNVYPLSVERVLGAQRPILNQESFTKTISLERKRSERSLKPFLLMLLHEPNGGSGVETSRVLAEIVSTLLISTRETDVIGWYQERYVLGIVFTELAREQKDSTVSTIVNRIVDLLKEEVAIDNLNKVNISLHLFPEDWDGGLSDVPRSLTLYPDSLERDDRKKLLSGVKRVMDIIGSGLCLLITAPVFAAVALVIKLSSPGPVFFRQQRVGQQARIFTMLKFRSMHVDNDPSVHKEYVKNLIAGQATFHRSHGNGRPVYKLTEDSRITALRAFLRRTSLDELPQLLNVLKGEMSLVGPRPPVPYEVDNYDIWHRRRLLEAKPGMTGLWQVSGRNRIKFDDMVRLDLLYAISWTPWLDLKILLRTPLAVLEGAQ